MTKERAWPVKAMYVLVAAALAISLIIMAAPAQKVSANPDLSEWSQVDTPTTDDWVLAPESTIIDYALASAGEVAYAVVHSDYEECFRDEVDNGYYGPDYLLKSKDGAATWDDITDAVADEIRDVLDLEEDDEVYFALEQVATDWVDPDFVAVALDLGEPSPGDVHVFFSTDGGKTFNDIGWVEDADVTLDEDSPHHGIADLVVSPKVSDKREVAIGGRDDDDHAVIFRSTVTVSSKSANDWEEATDYDGWDDGFTSISIADLIFSPNWATDKTILAVTVIGTHPTQSIYLQCGTWGTIPAWNEEATTLGIAAVPIMENAHLATDLIGYDRRVVAGLTLPSDYNSKTTTTRVLWVWVNYYDSLNNTASVIVKVDNDEHFALEQLGQVKQGKVWLTNISYKGTIEQGEALAGVLGRGTMTDGLSSLLADCCEGVQVYHKSPIKNMEICCETWKKACDGKLPTGLTAMAVSYVGENKAYAVALEGFMDYDEGAWSVSFDDGYIWNQLSLIDTSIDYFSDVAKSPNCNKTFLVSVNKVLIDYGCKGTGCDSVWVYAAEFPEEGYGDDDIGYNGHWLRTWTGQLGSDWWEGPCWDNDEAGMLRLAPYVSDTATPGEDDSMTVYLFDYFTGDVYRNDMETLACWDPIGSSEVEDIVDLAVQDKDTVYALGHDDGMVAKFDGEEWQEAVESEVNYGYTIAVWGSGNATYVLVGGEEGDVSYSKDGGETFTALEDVVNNDEAYVTVAFDTYFDTNKTIYAAVGWAGNDYDDPDNGIYSFVIGDSEEWTDLKAEPLENQVLPESAWTSDEGDDPVEVTFTGLVVDRPGNPFTNADNGGVIYASYVGYLALNDTATEGYWFTGAARSLEREITVCTSCLVWDFLQQGLTSDVGDEPWACPPTEAQGFEAYPDALKICGCLTPATSTNLFAIDSWQYYDMCDAEEGAVWTFEDCYAKKAPEPETPVVEADPCSCYSAPFTLKWDTVCDACAYEIQFALDAEFTMPVKVNLEGEAVNDYIITDITGDTPSYSVMGGEDGGLSCETTYYWRVRATKAATDQVIHSWWSVAESFAVPPSVQAGIITLVAPVPGALNQPTKSVGFSWDLQADADSFRWVLSKNSDLSAPLDSKNVTSKAATYGNTLDYATTYYWQVKAYNEGVLVGASSVGTFTTAATGAFCCPIDGLCFATEAQLIAHNATHPVPGTPFWVWVVIAIGAVLVIVVIVLIFRTRRV